MITITLEINRICNLRCSYCYITEKNGEQMTFETAKNSVEFAIQKIIKMNHKKRVININFLGGEPLISIKMMKKIVEYCEKRKVETMIEFQYTITSNGTIFDEKIYSFLLKYNFYLKVSLDGDEYVNNLNRKDIEGQGSYCLVKKNLHYLQQYEKNTNRLVQVSNVLTKNNYKYYNETVKFFIEKLGFRFIDTGFNSNERWTEEEVNEIKYIFDDILNYYIECAEKGKEFVWGILEDTLRGVNNIFRTYCCGAGIISFYISFDGKYYLCPMMFGEQYCLGNVNEGETETEFMKFIKKNNQNSEGYSLKCQTCEMEPYCMEKGCIFNKINKPDSSVDLCLKNRMFYNLIKKNYFKIYRVKKKSIYI